ncbi:glycosyltransferase [Terrabacter sp. GCM10028922]|uniref:glycosyltransferase n=1 Tax=Terrabacter sp. GCM10028922 TaxID=3273428 RepID=UPI0036238914
MTEGGAVLAVVPTLGERVDTLGPALASVRAQEGVRTTLVVVVPPAAEEARRIAAEHGAVVIDDPKRGLSAAVNAGIAAANGETYFSWIGDDDELHPGGLATLVGLLESDPGAVVAFGACDYMDDRGQVFAVSRAGRWARRVLAWGPDLIPQPASLTRLDAMRSVGPYDEGLRFVMDLDMFLRLRKHGRYVSTQARVAAYRWHPDALTVANRGVSIAEAEGVKRRHLPSAVRPLARLWERPVRLAINVVSTRLSKRARKRRA